jgi:hypothetical protein
MYGIHVFGCRLPCTPYLYIEDVRFQGVSVKTLITYISIISKLIVFSAMIVRVSKSFRNFTVFVARYGFFNLRYKHVCTHGRCDINRVLLAVHKC